MRPRRARAALPPLTSRPLRGHTTRSGRSTDIQRNALGRLAGRAAVAAAALVVALTAVPAAQAHAELLTTEPANDAVVERSPAQVVLRFSEAVETAFGSLRAYDSRARRVDSGQVERPRPETVAVGLDGDLADGTYTVTWRVVSADSHPIRGAFVFHVGKPGANPGGIAEQVLGGDTPEAVTVLFTVVRFADLALLLLCAGGAAALLLVFGDAAAALRRRLLGALGALAAALVVVAAAGIVLQGASAGGFGLGDAIRPSVVREVLDTRFGTVWAVQAVLAAALAVAALGLRGIAERYEEAVAALVVVLAAGLVLTPALSGHASSEGAVAFLADVAHAQAAAVWAGGLAFLLAGLARAGARRWELATRVVPRFSTLAVVSVAALVVAGVLNAYLEVRAWRGLWETTYGRLLLAKIALVLPLIALGAYNNRRAVPRLRGGLASAWERRRFLRVAGAELGLFVAVVAVTAVLVSEPPARAEVAPKGAYATTTALGPLELNLVVDPARAGTNVIHLYLTDRAGRPASAAGVRVSARLASRNVGPLRFTAHPLAPGHYAVHGADLALAGDWQLIVEARRGELELLRGSLSIPIRED